MKPVMQTKFGMPDGNCFAACIASIFELPLEAVPVFDTDENTGQWRKQIIQWCAERNLGWMQVRLGDGWLPDNAYLVAGGKSQRGLWHSVVWRNGQLAHDPHPDGTGIESPPDHYDLFVALDPARIVMKAD